jgi:hypothetical protein
MRRYVHSTRHEPKFSDLKFSAPRKNKDFEKPSDIKQNFDCGKKPTPGFGTSDEKIFDLAPTSGAGEISFVKTRYLHCGRGSQNTCAHGLCRLYPQNQCRLHDKGTSNTCVEGPYHPFLWIKTCPSCMYEIHSLLGAVTPTTTRQEVSSPKS